MTFKTLAIALFALLGVANLSACTTQSWYDAAKESAATNCRNQPQSEAERCLENLNKKTYDEYEKDRSEKK